MASKSFYKKLDEQMSDLKGAGVIPRPIDNGGKLSDLDRAYSEMGNAIGKAGSNYQARIAALNEFSEKVSRSPLMNDKAKGRRYREFEKDVSKIIKVEIANINKIAAIAASTPAVPAEPATPPPAYSPSASERAVSNIRNANVHVANPGNAIRGEHRPSIPSKEFANKHLPRNQSVREAPQRGEPVLRTQTKKVDPKMAAIRGGKFPDGSRLSAQSTPVTSNMPPVKPPAPPKPVTQPVNMQRPPEMKLPHGSAPINNAGKAIPIPQGRNAQDLAKKISTPAGPAMKAKDLGPVVGPKILPTKPANIVADAFSRDISADLFNRKSSLSASAPSASAPSASAPSASAPSLATSSQTTSLQIKPPAKVVESVTREDIQARADAMMNAVKEVRIMSDKYLEKMSSSYKKKNPQAEAKFKSFNKQLDTFLNSIEKVADRNSNSRIGNDTLVENKQGLDTIQNYILEEIASSKSMNNKNGRSEPFDSMLKVFEAKATVPKQNVQQESRLRNRG